MNQEVIKEVTACVQRIKEGGYIIFPSEIGWTIGCDAKNDALIMALANSGYNQYKALLLTDTGKLTRYVREIPEVIWNLVEFATKPLQLEFNATLAGDVGFNKEVEPVSFRIVKDDFSVALLQKLGKPVFTALLPIQTQPVKINTILNSSCYVVNLRLSAKANTEILTVIRFSESDRFQFIKK